MSPRRGPRGPGQARSHRPYDATGPRPVEVFDEQPGDGGRAGRSPGPRPRPAARPATGCRSAARHRPLPRAPAPGRRARRVVDGRDRPQAPPATRSTRGPRTSTCTGNGPAGAASTSSGLLLRGRSRVVTVPQVPGGSPSASGMSRCFPGAPWDQALAHAPRGRRWRRTGRRQRLVCTARRQRAVRPLPGPRGNPRPIHHHHQRHRHARADRHDRAGRHRDRLRAGRGLRHAGRRRPWGGRATPSSPTSATGSASGAHSPRPATVSHEQSADSHRTGPSATCASGSRHKPPPATVLESTAPRPARSPSLPSTPSSSPTTTARPRWPAATRRSPPSGRRSTSWRTATPPVRESPCMSTTRACSAGGRAVLPAALPRLAAHRSGCPQVPGLVERLEQGIRGARRRLRPRHRDDA